MFESYEICGNSQLCGVNGVIVLISVVNVLYTCMSCRCILSIDLNGAFTIAHLAQALQGSDHLGKNGLDAR